MPSTAEADAAREALDMVKQLRDVSQPLLLSC